MQQIHIMKKISISIIALALTMAFSGCSDRYDMPEPATPQLPAGTPVRISASMEPQTRLGIEDTDAQLVYSWQDNDSFRVYSASNPEGTCFTIDPDAERVAPSLASFVGTPVNAFQEGEKLYAVFDGSGAYTLDEDGNLVIDINGQNGKLNQNYQYLYGEAVYHEGESINFSLKHVVTMMKYRITLPEGVSSLKEFQIGTGYWSMATQATLVLGKSPSDYAGKFSSGTLACNQEKYRSQNFLPIEGEFLPDTTGIVTIYAYMLPAQLYYTNNDWNYQNDFNPLFTACDGKGEVYVSTASTDPKSIEAGKTYRVTSGLYALAAFDNEQEANAGEPSTPYLISTAEQLYSFMYRSLYGMRNPNGRTFNTCSYRLKNDIELHDEHPWAAVSYNAWDGMFDGAGHSLKGEITFGITLYQSIFSALYDTTVSGLTLDFSQITLAQKSWNVHRGLLATEIQSSVVTGCANRSTVETVSGAYHLFGLIGYSWNSTISFCSNTGDIRCGGEAWRVGGIVAEADRTCIEGCYNTGTFYVKKFITYDKVYVGGVAGKMGSESVMANCWSNSLLQIEDAVYDDHFNDASGSLFVGGLAGSSEGTIQNCFWNAGMGVATNGIKAVDCASFAGKTPDAAQIALLNAQIAAQGWKFNEKGALEASKETTIPSLPKEEW